MRRILPVRLRAIAGLVALYGLLLQAVFGAALPLPALASPDGIVCQHEGDAAPAGGGPVHHDGACCLAACLAGSSPPPPLASVDLPAPDRMAVALAWSPVRSASGAPPTTRSHSARGPPAA